MIHPFHPGTLSSLQNSGKTTEQQEKTRKTWFLLGFSNVLDFSRISLKFQDIHGILIKVQMMSMVHKTY